MRYASPPCARREGCARAQSSAWTCSANPRPGPRSPRSPGARTSSCSTTSPSPSARTLAGKPLGTQGDATATSFFPSKPLGAYGDGGALLTESAERAALYRSLRSHGEGTTRYEVLHTGMNGRLDTLQAAVLLAKLDVFDEELSARERIAEIYESALSHLVTIPARVPRSTSAWAIYAVLLRGPEQRAQVQAGLRAEGVPTAIYYPRPLHLQPAYTASHDGTALPVSENLARRILALPIHPDLSDKQAERVCDAMHRALG